MNAKKVINFLSSVQFFILNCIILGIIAVIGIIVPQNLSPEIYKKEYGDIFSAFFQKTGWHHIFSSLWFIIPLGAFSLNLALCVFKRFFSLWRFLQNLPDMHDRAAAIKRCAGIAGSLFLHAGLILLVAGGIIQHYKGDLTHVLLSKGKKTGVDKFAVELLMHDFTIVQNDKNEPLNYQTDLEIFDTRGNSIKRGKILVNHPLQLHNLYFYQSEYRIKPDAIESLYIIITDSTNRDTVYHGPIPYKTNFQVDTSTIFIRCNAFYGDFVFDIKSRTPLNRSANHHNPAFDISLFMNDSLSSSQWIFLNFPAPHKSHGAYNCTVTSYEPSYASGIDIRKKPAIFLVWAGIICISFGLVLVFYFPFKPVSIADKKEQIKA